MTTEQKQVHEFMQAFGQETPDKPTVPSLEVRKLRAKLVIEECLELIDALGLSMQLTELPAGYDGGTQINVRSSTLIEFHESKPMSLLETADALADLDYVGPKGTAIACGIDMEPIFAEVHRSNMSKMWTTEEVLEFSGTGASLRSFPIDSFVGASNRQGNFKFIKKNLEEKSDRCWICLNSDSKVIKSPSYSPANLKPILEAQSK